MDSHQTLVARPNEPQPRAHMGGTQRDVPIIRFGGEHAPACDIHLGRITDLSGWLTSFAASLVVLAAQVEQAHRPVGAVEL